MIPDNKAAVALLAINACLRGDRGEDSGSKSRRGDDDDDGDAVKCKGLLTTLPATDIRGDEIVAEAPAR